MNRLVLVAGVAALPGVGFAAAGCLGSAAARETVSAQVIDVHTRDFAFEAPDTVRAGLTTIRLANRGHELHHVQLLRIAASHGFAEFQDSVAAGGRLPEWAEPVGGPNVPGPVPAQVTLRLSEGTYAMICLIPSPTDGQSHFRKGMVHRLVVVPPSGGAAAEPQADSRIGLEDYAFAVDSVLPAGKHLIRVENAGGQKHELVLFRLTPGKTPEDLLAWASKLIGPPPGTLSGGTTAMAPGGMNYVAVDLVPGEYALVCFARNPGDPLSHAFHGMVRRVRVS
jgi:hypothetical protein